MNLLKPRRLGMFKVFFQGVYSTLISPIVYFSFNRSYPFFRLVTKPLLTGPLDSSRIGRVIDKAVFELDRGDCSPDVFIQNVSTLMRDALGRGELEGFLTKYDEKAENKDITLARKLFFRPLKWWY